MRSWNRVALAAAIVYVLAAPALAPAPASANCTSTAGTVAAPDEGAVITCDTNPPNPFTTGIANGIDSGTNVQFSVDVLEGAEVSVTGADAILLRNDATVTVQGTLTSDQRGIGSISNTTGDDNTVTVSGTITAGTDGIFLRDESVITASGIIDAQVLGIRARDDSTIESSATITSAGDRGISVRDDNTITSSGSVTVQGSEAAIGLRDRNNLTTSAAVMGDAGEGIFARDENVVRTTAEVSSTSGSAIQVRNRNSVRPAANVTSGTGRAIQLGDDNQLQSGSISITAGGSSHAIDAGDGNVISLSQATVSSADGRGLSVGNNNSITIEGVVMGGGASAAVVTGQTNSLTNRGTIRGGGTTAIRFGSGANRLTLDTGSVIEGMIDGGSGSSAALFDELVLQGSGSEDDVIVDFERLTMAGSDWTLSGDSTIGGQGINVQSGVLRIDGQVSVTGVSVVEAGGTLSGDGALMGPLRVEGTVAPGNSIGSLTFNAYVPTETSVLHIEGDASGATDQVIVNVAGILGDNGTLRLDPDPAMDFVAAVVDGSSSVAGVSGTFAAVESTGRGAAGASYENNQVIGATANVAGLDALLDAKLYTAYLFLDNMSGRVHSIRAGTEDSAAYTAPAPRQYALNDAGGSAIPRQLATLSGPYAVKGEKAGSGVWLRGVGGYGKRDAKASAPSHDYSVYGVALGGDHRFDSGWTLGGALSYTRAEAEVDQGLAGSTSDNYMAGVYGGFDNEHLFADFALMGGFGANDDRRRVGVMGSIEEATTDYGNSYLGLRAAIGTTFELGWNMVLRPVATLDYAWLRFRSHGEVGASLGNLQIGELDGQAVKLQGLLAATREFSLGDKLRIVPELRGGVLGQLATGNRDVDVVFKELGGASSTLHGLAENDVRGLVGGGATLWISEGLGAFIDYGGEFGSETTVHSGTAGVILAF